jgi:hypothetical protein
VEAELADIISTVLGYITGESSMNSVPVWVLTAVIEMSLLCTGALSVVSVLLWRRQRRLRRALMALQYTLAQQTAVSPSLPIMPDEAAITTTPSDWSLPVTAVEPPSVATTVIPPAADLVAQKTAAAVSAEEVGVGCTAEVEPEEAEPPVGLSQAMLDSLFAAAQQENILENGTGETAPEEAEAEPTVGLSQEMLDSLFAAAQQDDIPEDEEGETEALLRETQQSLAAMFSENATMEEQINHLEAKNQCLREAIEALQANIRLPLEAQQEITVPEKTMQEVEQGLQTLRYTRERMWQQLKTHGQLLGRDKANHADAPTSEGDGTTQRRADQETGAGLQEEVRHLRVELEQRTADFQRIQAEYEQLLTEYQRIFESTSPSVPTSLA